MTNPFKHVERALRALKKEDEFFDHLKTVSYYPHSGQKPILKKFLTPGLKDIFLQCSRNFGKSTLMGIDAVYHALRYPNFKYYLIAPFRSQAYEIYWASSFLKSIIPPDSLLEGEKGENKSELRFLFKNGSYIKLDGSDNEDALRGYKPHRLGCDEFQAWKESAWVSMEPNLLAHDATVIKIGTPPDFENHFVKNAEFIKRRMAERSKRHLYLHRTIYDNPLIAKERIEELRQGFIERGEELIWKREYMAEYVPGGASAIFPMFSEAENVRPPEWIKARIAKDAHKMDYLTIFDPSGTRFACGLLGYNRYTSELFLFDELVRTEASKISVGQIMPIVIAKEKEHYYKTVEPFRVYDEAALLFAEEVVAQFGIGLNPTQKKQNDKSNNISLVRDALIKGKLWISERCPFAIRDIQAYRTNERGKIVKELDDMVDVILYGVAESGYSFNSKPINIETDTRRVFRPEDDLLDAAHNEQFVPSGEQSIVDQDFFDLNIWH